MNVETNPLYANDRDLINMAKLLCQTQPMFTSFHQTEPTFFTMTVFLTGRIDRWADGVPMRAEIDIDGKSVWVPCNAVLSRDGAEPFDFSQLPSKEVLDAEEDARDAEANGG